MNITVTIMLGGDEFAGDLAGNSSEIAEKVLQAAGGDPEKDMCSVSIQDYGQAGGVPMVPPTVPIVPPVTPVFEAFNSTFATNNAPPPGDKQTRTSAATPADTTAVYVDNQSVEGDDISAKFLALLIDDTIEIRGVNDVSRYAMFRLTADPINQTDYVELPVSHFESAGSLTNSACTLTIPVRGA